MIEWDTGTTSVAAAIEAIVETHERICGFWQRQAVGWAPRNGALLLENSRLDRLVSLSRTLRLWAEPSTQAADEGRLILAWANLGILVEGTMTWFLCVWEHLYARNPMRSRNGFDLSANRLTFEELTQFYRQHVWANQERDAWDKWLRLVRARRNAIHAFNERDIGTWIELRQAILRYAAFLNNLDSRAPYPDGAYES